MHNGELAKKSRVSPLTRKECPTKLPLMQWCKKKFWWGDCFYQWHMVVICILCSPFVTSQFYVIFMFPN